MTRSLLGQIATTTYRWNKATRIARAYEKGGVPAIGKQYVRRVARRREIGLLRRMGLWP